MAIEKNPNIFSARNCNHNTKHMTVWWNVPKQALFTLATSLRRDEPPRYHLTSTAALDPKSL